MSFDPERPADVLRELRAEEAPADGAARARARRERTVAHLRGLQARAAVRRELGTSWRWRLLVAAALLVASGALAASSIPWARLVGKAATETAPQSSEALREQPRAKSPTVSRPRATGETPDEATPRAGASFEAAATPATAASNAPVATHAPTTMSAPAAPPTAATDAPHAATFANDDARDPSTLADENRLMQSALLAARQGQNALTEQRLTELLSRYPSSPLAQNALVERFRSLRRSGDRTAAARQARRYLEAYPRGMASDEARQVAGLNVPGEPRDGPR
jgi:hypothetical protein